MSIEQATTFLKNLGLQGFNTSQPVKVNGKEFYPTRKQGLHLRPYRDEQEIGLSPALMMFKLPNFGEDEYRKATGVSIPQLHHQFILDQGRDALKDTPYHPNDLALMGQNSEGKPVGLRIRMAGDSKLVLDDEMMEEHEESLLPVPAWEVRKYGQSKTTSLRIGKSINTVDPELSTYFPPICCHFGGSSWFSWEVSTIVNQKRMGIPLQGPISWEYAINKVAAFDTAADLFTRLGSNPGCMGLYQNKRDSGNLLREIIAFRLQALADLLQELAEAREEQFEVEDELERLLADYFKTTNLVVPAEDEDFFV